MTTSAFAPSPSRMPLFPTATAPAAPAATAQHLHAPSYFSTPRSSAPTDSTRIWAAMPPFQNTSHDQSQAQRKSNPPPANAAQENNGGGLLFITGNKPDDFKSKKNMTKVRKKAMGSYLEHTKDKKPRDSLERSRLKSDGSTASSRASNGSPDGDSELLTREDALRIWKGEKGNRRQSSRKQSSPVKSPGSCDHDQGTSPDMQIANLGQSVNFVLPTAPIVLPMRSGIELPYDVTHPRPFVSIGKSLDPFRTMFQANHPRVSVEELKFHCSRVFGTRAMGQHWIPAIVKSPHAFLSTLCIASAHHDAIQEQPTESLRTVALRQEVIHLISQNLLHPTARVDDDNVIALTQLIASEIISREDMSLNYHETGVEAMITQRGGVNQLGVKGRLASTISWVSLESAILREAAPRSVYSDFCASACTRSYPSTATVPESPVYCPRGEFETIKRSKMRDPRILDLLKEIRMMTELFLHETRQSRQNFQSLKNLHKKITTQYPSIADLQKTNMITQDDWRYEAIRIAAVIQATAIIKRTPLSEALTHISESRKPLSLYTSAASKSSISHEPQISPLTLRQDSPVTNVSTSPSYTTSPVFPQSNTNPYFMARSSVSSGGSPHNLSMNLSYFSPPATAPPTESAALLLNLKTAIQNSNLSDCWADMAGVLLWIGLIVGAASRKSENTIKKWFSALAVRVSIVLCFEHPEAVHSTLLKVGEIVEALGTGSASTSAAVETPRRESETLGKRRKVS